MDELPIKQKKYYSKDGIENSATLGYWFEPKEPDKGGIGLLVSLTGASNFPVERVSKFMWDSFRESYISAKENKSSSLKIAIKSTHKRLIELIKNEDEMTENGLDLHLCGIIVHGENIYLCRIGNPEILLIRDGKTINVTQSLPGYDGVGLKDEIPVGNFQMKKSDIFLFSTPQLAGSVIELITDVKDYSWDTAIEQLDIFSEGLVGSQYLWLVGYRIDDRPKMNIPSAGNIPPSMSLDKLETATTTERDNASQGQSGVRAEDFLVKNVEDSGSEIQNAQEVKDKSSGKDKIAGLLDKVKNWFRNIDLVSIKRKIGGKISALKLRGSPRKKKMYIDKKKGFSFGQGDNKKKIIGVGIILSIVVVVILIVSAQRNKVYKEEIESDISSIEEEIEEAEGLWQSDRMQAEEIIERVTAGLGELEDKKLTTDQSDKLEELEDDIQTLYDQIHRITALSEDNDNFEILFDAYLDIDESVDISDMDFRNDSLFLVDKSTHGVYEYDISAGSIEAVADSQSALKEPVLIAVGEKYMFVYDNKIGMLSLDLEEPTADQAFDSMPELSENTIEEATSISTFADNIYILKSSEARVLKSYPAGFGYSYPEEYFRHGGLDKAKDILIDGNIYVVGNSSESIYKFYGGNQDTFTLTEMDEDFDGVCCGYTNVSDSNPLYVFDIGNERVVEIEKGTGEKHPGQGVMTSQYLYRGSREDIFKDVKEIVVDGEEKYMYVLDGTRVLRISL